MIPWIKTYPTGNANISSRKGEASLVKRFTFKNADGTDYDITGYDFEYSFFRSNTLETLFFKLTVGDGLTIVNTNKLDVLISNPRSSRPVGNYFALLKDTENDHSWIAGIWELITGQSKRTYEDDETVTVNLSSGEEVTITVSIAGSGGTSVIWEDWDASTDILPVDPQVGIFYQATTNSTTLLLPDGGVVTAGTIITPKVANPGTDITVKANWAIISSMGY